MSAKLNNAIANIGNELPEDALSLIENLPKDLWDPYAGQPSLIERLASLDHVSIYDPKLRVDNSKLLSYIFETHPPKNKNEKQVWADACVISVTKGAVFEMSQSSYSGHENVFIELWNKTKTFLSEDEQFKIGSEVFAKRDPLWTSAALIVAEEAICNWNRPGVESPQKNQIYVSGNRFFANKMPPLYWVQEKSVFEVLVSKGASLNTEIDGKPLYEHIQARPVESFNGAQERRAVLSWLDKTLGQKDTQETAWEKVRMCRQASDIDRLLKDSKKEWRDWRGPLGENLVQYVAMFQPNYLWKILKRSECDFADIEHKDNAGRGLSTWLGLGVAIYEGRDSSLKIEEKLKGSKFNDIVFTPKKETVDLAILGLSVLDLSKEVYWGESGIKRIGGYNREMPVVDATKWVEGGEVYKFFGQRYSYRGPSAEINTLVSRMAEKEYKMQTELGKRIFYNTLLNTTGDWVPENLALYVKAKKEHQEQGNLWSSKVEYLLANEDISEENRDLFSAYVYNNIIQSSYNSRRYFAAPQKDILVTTPFVLEKYLVPQVNPEKVMEKYESAEDVKSNVLSMGWNEKVVMAWQHKQLKERAEIATPVGNHKLNAL